tara:strand:- start:1809 stop:5042 length:3234 start_codon:yes stop_codon:yes gene_type:complete
MSSYLVAKGIGKSLNSDTYEVRIIRTAAGSDETTEFSLGPDGFVLKYESVDENVLVPGIVHSRCKVTTLWPNSLDTELDAFLTALALSTDGDYLLEVLKDGTRYWLGSILVEEFSITEDSQIRQVDITASDAISLLKHVDYNNAGTAYTGAQTIYEILINIQEKWALYAYLEDNTTTEARFNWAEDVYSLDDYIMSALSHPAGTDKRTIQRSRVSTHSFKTNNSVNVKEYISAYDLLMSLCITYQWRLYSYGSAWSFIPVALSGVNTNGTTTKWDGTTIDLSNLVSGSLFNYPPATNNTIRKSSDWTISYTAPHNEVRLTRDTAQGAKVISGYNFPLSTVQSNTSLPIPGSDTEPSDTFYNLTGRLYLTGSAISVDDDSVGNLVLSFTIKYGSGASAKYYRNKISENVIQQNNGFYSSTYLDSQPIIAQDPEFIDTSAPFYYVPEELQGVYQPSIDTGRYIDFGFVVPPPPSELTGVEIQTELLVFDENGQNNTTYKNALTALVVQLVLTKWSNDQLELIDDFDIVATTNTGRSSIDLGTTIVGQLGAVMGRIDVQTSAGFYGSTIDWVCQADDTEREINILAVAEILAMHNKPKRLERGSILYRGTVPNIVAPYKYLLDFDSANVYTPINWQLNATNCEIDVTLHKVGRDAISLTTEAQNTGDATRLPANGSTGQGPSKPLPSVRTYNRESVLKFNENWTSIIGTDETLEAYYTIMPDGTGRSVDNQGDSPLVGYDIRRKWYVSLGGLQGATGSWVSLPIGQPNLNDTLAEAFNKLPDYISGLSASSSSGALSFVISYEEVSNRLLDIYAGSQAAYSLRLLRAGYTGAAVQVRRSDNTTQDIGFSGVDLDTSALATFCGAGDGFVRTWYDQSGNSRNAVQYNTAAQPKIYNSGSTILINGRPAVEFDGNNDVLLSTAFAPNPNGAYNLASVSEYNRSGTPGQYTGASWSTTSSLQNFQTIMLATSKVRFACRYNNGQAPRTDSTNTFATNTQIISTATFAHGICEAYINGTQELDKFGQNISAHPNNNSNVLSLGARFDQAYMLQGTIQEFIVFSNSTAHDAEDISDDINTTYGAF